MEIEWRSARWLGSSAQCRGDPDSFLYSGRGPHMIVSTTLNRAKYRPGKWLREGCRIRCFTVEMPMPSQLRRPPEVRAGAQRRAPIWRVALRRQMLHPVRRAAPSLADPGPTPPCCPSNMAKKKLQIRLGASTHTHSSAAACSAQGALPTLVGQLSRLVLLPPALLTPCHGPICAGKWSTPRAVGLGSAPLVARLIAVGARQARDG